MAKVTHKGNPINTIGDLPAVGSQAPDFRLTTTGLSDVSLKDFAGKTVVLNIYVSVDTGLCAASTVRFNKEAAGRDDLAILCVSADLPFAHKRFCAAEGIENVVSVSTIRSGGAFGKAYGVRIVDGLLEGLHARSVVVIDSSGKVKYTQLVPEIGQEPNYDEALAAI